MKNITSTEDLRDYLQSDQLPEDGFNEENTIEGEIAATGFRYSVNDDGTYDVCYDHEQDSWFGSSMHHVATIKADDRFYYIDNNCGLGWGEYPKADWSLVDAIKDQCGD